MPTQHPTNPDLFIGEDARARPKWAYSSKLMLKYYDLEWGTHMRREEGVYERLMLEVFQDGRSRDEVLEKRQGMRAGLGDFMPSVVAGFTEVSVMRLLATPDVIQDEEKLQAAITNAKATIELRPLMKGGLGSFVWQFQPRENMRPELLSDIPAKTSESEAMSKALQEAGFVGISPELCFKLMQAIGMVNGHLIGSHRRSSSMIWP